MKLNTLLLLTLTPVLGLFLPVTASAQTQRLPRAALLDKIRGGWAGQMIGVAYGAPTEFKSNAKIGEWDLTWKDGMLENTINQDDLYVEMTFAQNGQTKELSVQQTGGNCVMFSDGPAAH